MGLGYNLKKVNKIELFTDGASWGNPGKAGAGVVIYDSNKKVINKFGKFIGEATNNVAEYMALIYGLEEALILGAQNITVNLDSQLIANQLEGLYKVKEPTLKVLFDQASRLMQGFKKIEIKNIERQKNKEADKLANLAIKEAINKNLMPAKTAPRETPKAALKQKELFNF